MRETHRFYPTVPRVVPAVGKPTDAGYRPAEVVFERVGDDEYELTKWPVTLALRGVHYQSAFDEAIGTPLADAPLLWLMPNVLAHCRKIVLFTDEKGAQLESKIEFSWDDCDFQIAAAIVRESGDFNFRSFSRGKSNG